MIKSKKILASIILIAISFSLLCSCGKNESKQVNRTILTTNDGTEYKEGMYAYYLNLYAYQLYATAYSYYQSNDSYKNQFESVDAFYKSYLNQTYKTESGDEQHYSDYITNAAKEAFLQYVIVEKEFDLYNLSFTSEQQTKIDDQYNDSKSKFGDDNVVFICNKLNISEDDFKSLMSTNQAKRTLLTNKIVGEGGEYEITEEAMHKEYNENYKRFKYCVFSKIDSDGNALNVSDTAKLNSKATEAYNKAVAGNKFEDLIVNYSDAYIKEDDSTDDKSKQTNQQMLDIGVITDNNGIFDNTYYQTYNSVIDTEIVKKLFSMNVGEIANVELSNSIWLIKAYDINETEDCFNTRASDIFSNMTSDAMTQMFSLWSNKIGYKFTDDVVNSYDINNLDNVFLSIEPVDGSGVSDIESNK